MTGTKIQAAALALLVAAAPASAWAQATGGEAPRAEAQAAPPDAETLREARLLAEKTGGAQTVRTLLRALRDQIVAGIAKAGKSREEAARIVDEIMVPELDAHAPELTEAIAHVWASHLTAQEIHGLIAFYDTPLGRKLLTVQPLMFRENYALGQAWGRRVLQDAFRKHADELRRRGVNL